MDKEPFCSRLKHLKSKQPETSFNPGAQGCISLHHEGYCFVASICQYQRNLQMTKPRRIPSKSFNCIFRKHLRHNNVLMCILIFAIISNNNCFFITCQQWTCFFNSNLLSNLLQRKVNRSAVVSRKSVATKRAFDEWLRGTEAERSLSRDTRDAPLSTDHRSLCFAGAVIRSGWDDHL